MRSKKVKTPETDSAQPAKRGYEMTPAATEQRVEAAKARGAARREEVNTKLDEKIEYLLNTLTPAEMSDANFKERVTAIGVFHDKRYGKEQSTTPVSAIQINISTMGGGTDDEPIRINANPAPKADPS